MALSISKGLAGAGGTSRGQEIIPSWVGPRPRLQWVGGVERPVGESHCCERGAFLCDFETPQRVRVGGYIQMMSWRFVGMRS